MFKDAPNNSFAIYRSVGVGFVEVADSDVPLSKIAPNFADFDICLSMRDKINIKRGYSENIESNILSVEKEVAITENCTLVDGVESKNSNAATSGEKGWKKIPTK